MTDQNLLLSEDGYPNAPDIKARTIKLNVVNNHNLADVVIDDADFHLIAERRWRVGKHGYVICNFKKEDGSWTTDRLHRLILGLHVGDGIFVDHINGDKSDNRRSNLRICSNAENLRNVGKYSTNKSGFKGVSWAKHENKWRAQIMANRKSTTLGYFNSPEDAHAAYCKAAHELHGEFARTE